MATARLLTRLFLLAFGAVICSGVDDCDDCDVSSEAELSAAFSDQNCSGVRVVAWDSESLVASVPSHVQGIAVYGGNASTLRVIAISGAASVSVSELPTLDRLELAGVLSVDLSRLDSLVTADISYMTSLPRDFEYVLSAYALPSLASLAVVAAEDDRAATLLLSQVPWGTLEVSSDSVLRRSSLIVSGETMTPETLMSLGSGMQSVLLQFVGDDFVRTYKAWLEGEGYEGSLLVESCGPSIDDCEIHVVL
jgi:hypothetical protein